MRKDAAEPAQASYPFFPNHLFVECLVAISTLLVLVLLAVIWQTPLEEMADPGDASYVPRPEWYFLFYFQLLKYFEGALMVVGTVVLPLLALTAFLLLPFLDTEDTGAGVKKRLAVGLACILAVTALTVVAMVEDAEQRMDLPPITEQHLVAGKDIFNRFCILCHSMDGKGGFMAPDLTQVGARVNRTYIERVIMNPKLVSQTTIMSVIPLSDEERHDVSAYLARKK